MRMRLELGVEDVKAGVNKNKIEDIDIYDFHTSTKNLIEKAEYVVYKSPRGKKKVIKSKSKRLATTYITGIF